VCGFAQIYGPEQVIKDNSNPARVTVPIRLATAPFYASELDLGEPESLKLGPTQLRLRLSGHKCCRALHLWRLAGPAAWVLKVAPGMGHELPSSMQGRQQATSAAGVASAIPTGSSSPARMMQLFGTSR
jgi:hypothetical protein